MINFPVHIYLNQELNGSFYKYKQGKVFMMLDKIKTEKLKEWEEQ